MEVVDEISEGRDTLEVVEGGGGEFTTGVNILEEGEGGGGSTGRKMMPVGFCFFGAACETFESSFSESDSNGFRVILYSLLNLFLEDMSSWVFMLSAHAHSVRSLVAASLLLSKP